MSVVVTTFNRLAYLRAALTSVEAQTYRNIQVVILDDGSSDGTTEFLARFNPWFPCLVLNYSGKERSFLRNAGVAQTTGKLIAFLDDDDEWLPEKLERQVAFFSRYPAAAMTFCQTEAIDSTGARNAAVSEQHRAGYRRELKAGLSYTALAAFTLIFTSSVMVRRHAFEEVRGFRPDIIGAEDWDFYLRMARDHLIVGQPEELVRYRVHEGNSAAGGVERSQRVGKARIRAAEQHLARLSRVPEDRRARSLLLRAIAQNHYWLNSNKYAARFAAASIASSPASLRLDTLTLLLKAAYKSLR